MVGGSFTAVMGVKCFEPSLLHRVRVPTKLWCSDEFSTDLLVLGISRHAITGRIILLNRRDVGDVAVVYSTFLYVPAPILSE